MPRVPRPRAYVAGHARTPVTAGQVLLRHISVSPGLDGDHVRLVQVDTSPGLLDMLKRHVPASRPSPALLARSSSGKITANKHEAASPGRETASTTATPAQGVTGGCTLKSDV